MEKIRRKAVISHPAAKLFDLVNDTPSYVKFVPYCTRGEVIASEGLVRIAELEFKVMGMAQVVRTKNTLQAPKRIDLELQEGPFSHLVGSWIFEEKDGVTEVEINFEFEAQWGMMGSVFAPLFRMVLDRVVQDFSEYADEVYGS